MTTSPTNTHDLFDVALSGSPVALLGQDGRTLPLDPVRWYQAADGEDRWLLERCTGPTLDLGCGPGRLVVALAERGVTVLGVDCSARAVRECRSRGGTALRADLFVALPGEGQWDHVLLVDGNIGIGGDPARLLKRTAQALRPGGSVLVETAPPARNQGAQTWWRGRARLSDLADSGSATDWFPWAVVDASALVAIAEEVGFTVGDRYTGERQFVQLHQVW